MKKILFLLLLAFTISSVNALNASNGESCSATDSLDLAIQHPKLTSIPDCVYKKTDLRVLDVSGNRIGSISRDILKLENLKSLYLSGNLYLKDLPDFLGEMKSLKTIYFEGMERTWSQAKLNAVKEKFAKKGIKVVLKQQYGEVIEQQ